MKVVALICLGSFMITSLIVGIRVAMLFSRTRKLPELLLSIALLFTGFLAFAVGTTAKIFVEGTEPLRRALVLAGLGTECVGVMALVAFSWRVFHPKSRAGTVFAVLVAAFIGAALIGEVSSDQYLRYSDSIPISGPWVPLGLAARGCGPAWVAFECFRYHAKLRKRARLGLAEPVVVRRVAAWGIALGASALAYVTSVTHRLVYGTGLREHDWAVALVSVLALVSAVGIALAFFPGFKSQDE